MTKTVSYKTEEIFTKIDGDDKNVLLNIPPDIMEKMGWQAGDALLVSVNDDGEIIIQKK